MTKTLQEIQQENRRLIMQIVHDCDFDKKAGYELDKLFEPISLSRVLLTLPKEIFDIGWIELERKNNFMEFSKGDHGVFVWNLIKETLEEQSENTQRKIYELLSK